MKVSKIFLHSTFDLVVRRLFVVRLFLNSPNKRNLKVSNLGCMLDVEARFYDNPLNCSCTLQVSHKNSFFSNSKCGHFSSMTAFKFLIVCLCRFFVDPCFFFFFWFWRLKPQLIK